MTTANCAHLNPSKVYIPASTAIFSQSNPNATSHNQERRKFWGEDSTTFSSMPNTNLYPKIDISA